jgi:spore coat protein H
MMSRNIALAMICTTASALAVAQKVAPRGTVISQGGAGGASSGAGGRGATSDARVSADGPNAAPAPSSDGGARDSASAAGTAPTRDGPPDDGSVALLPGEVLPAGGYIAEQAAIFDDRLFRTFALTISDADLAKMADTAYRYFNTPRENEVVPAMLKIDNQDVGRVGVRYKGSWGTLRPCFDSTGKLTCPKVSICIKFNAFEPDKRWRGINDLNLHSLIGDGAMLRERLAYQIFRRMDIPAPRSVHGRVSINGTFKGVYAVTEEIDGRFTSDRWPRLVDGHLIKEAWIANSTEKSYLDALRTNELMPRQPLKIWQLSQAVRAAPNPAEVARVLDRWMSLEYLWRYMAVEVAIADIDGITRFSCDAATGMYCGNHNYYMYEAEREDRIWLVPWDLDLTFWTRSEFDAVTPWDKPQADCTQRWMAWGSKTMAPACDTFFRGLVAAGRPGYLAAVNRLLDGPFQVAAMQADLDRWAAQIDAAVRMDPGLMDGYSGWRNELMLFRASLVMHRQRMEAIR